MIENNFRSSDRVKEVSANYLYIVKLLAKQSKPFLFISLDDPGTNYWA